MDTGPVYCTVCLFTSQQWGRYQIILLGDRGTCVWTTCQRSLPGIVLVRSRTCASELPQDYKSDTLPLDYRATLCHITSSILQFLLKMSSSNTNASGKHWHHSQTTGSTTCISQGSVTTVLMWGGQNYSRFVSIVYSWCCTSKIIRISSCCMELFKK